MKAFVIKNKEGKYWCGNDIFSATIDIRKTYICEDFDFISKVINKLLSEGLLTDCEVVEITISEGDLDKHQNQKAIECLKEVLEELNYGDYAFGTIAKQEVEDVINDKIKELEGKKEW